MPKKKTHEQFIKEVYDLVGDGYRVIGEYETNHTKILVRHNECGNEYEVAPTHFLNGRRCPKCRDVETGNRSRKTHEQFSAEIRSLTGGEYTFLGVYKNSSHPITVRHNECGLEWETRPNDFLRGKRCLKCAGGMKKNTEQFRGDVVRIWGDEYSVIGEYVNALVPILVKHNKCGNTYETTPHHMIRNHGCPRCRESKGEKRVERYLRDNHTQYERQYRTKGCRDKLSLPFDFAIFESGELLALIEYDGAQHYAPTDWLGGVKTFEITKYHDNIKTNYCLSSGIFLIRIPHTVESIEDYLKEALLKINVQQLALL